MTRRSINLIQLWLTLALFSVPALAFGLAGYLRFRSGYFAEAQGDPYSYAAWIVTVTAVWTLVVEHLQLNRIDTLLTLQTGILTTAKATTYCAGLALSLAFFYRGVSFSRIFVVLGCLLVFVVSLAVTHLFRGTIYIFRRSANGRMRVAILGADAFAAGVERHLTRNPLTRCEVACFVALPQQTPSVSGPPVVAWDCLDDVGDVFHCREVRVALPPQRFGELQEIMKRVQYLCVPARVALDLGEGVFVPERLFNFCGLQLLDVRPYPVDTIRYAVGKRIFDMAFSLLALGICAPVMVAIALAIKLTSRGPVFFAQERVSLNGKRFHMLKFRTMYVQDSTASNTRHTSQGDPRVTRLGRFLRQTSLDELPQFFNVLKGDMSVVGPRPELTYFVQKFRAEIPAYMARHNVKCGITGWAQINGLRGSDTSIPERIKCDLYYMRNWSMALDLKIIFLTVLNVLMNRHAY